ncbi:MAG: phosphatidylserine decarboxylase [Deltaproteobacteria bacterium]|nr:phosphatidylserine decarboxylase [Deltaproteobacteria bacterium]
MDRRLLIEIATRLPQGALSRLWGRLARQRRPRLGVAALKRLFVAAAGIDMGEAEHGIGDYDTLEDLFVRRLRPGARRIALDPTAFISPVDGRVGACGKIEGGTLLQVKGRRYRLERLLGDAAAAARFAGGSFVTLYLSPADYHRVHAPVSGEVRAATVIPGRLLPVFPEAVDQVDELFAKNERLITYIDNPDVGTVAVVKVGATLVGRVTVSYDPELCTNRAGGRERRVTYAPPHLLQKGAELGAFELGSTVVLLTEAKRVKISALAPDSVVRMGQRIGTIVGRKATARTPTKSKNRRPRPEAADG